MSTEPEVDIVSIRHAYSEERVVDGIKQTDLKDTCTDRVIGQILYIGPYEKDGRVTGTIFQSNKGRRRTLFADGEAKGKTFANVVLI